MAHRDGVVSDTFRSASDAVRRQVVTHVRRHPVIVCVARVERIARRSEHRRYLYCVLQTSDNTPGYEYSSWCMCSLRGAIETTLTLILNPNPKLKQP